MEVCLNLHFLVLHLLHCAERCLQVYSKRLLLQWKSDAELRAGKWLNTQLSQLQESLPPGSDFQEIPQNGLIETEFNGMTIRMFLKGKELHVEHEIPDVGINYYVFDEHGNAVAPQWPAPLEDYSVEIDPRLILKRTTVPLHDGLTQETIEMKWGKHAVLTRHANGKLANILVTDSTVNHNDKKIYFVVPNAKKKSL